MSCYVAAPLLRRAERIFFLVNHVTAETPCHVLSRRVDSTRIALQATCELSIQHLNHTTEERRESTMSQCEAET